MSIYNFPEINWVKSLNTNNSSRRLKILYTSRQNTNRRLTEDSHLFLTKLVKTYNGTICEDLSMYPIEEQIELFRSHNCVIGVHGNNLTGIMWMNPSSHIFEILPFEFKQDVYDYQCMSLCMKHNYTQINCIGEYLHYIMDIDNSSRKLLECHLYMLFNIMRD